MAEPFCGALHSLERCGIEQDARLIAVLRNALTLQVKIREKKRGLAIVFGDGLPEPVRSLSAVALLTIGSVQVTLSHGEFFAAVSCQSFRLRVLAGD
jgi:hypothetical protein